MATAKAFDQWSVEEVKIWVRSWTSHNVNQTVINKVLSSVDAFQINGMTLLCISNNDLTMDLGFNANEANIMITRRDNLYQVPFNPNNGNNQSNSIVKPNQKQKPNQQIKAVNDDIKQNDDNNNSSQIDDWNKGYPAKSSGKEVYVCMQKGHHQTKISINSTFTICQLKEKYLQQSNYNGDPNEIVLLYMKQVLDENKTLEDYCIGFQKVSYVWVAQKMVSNTSTTTTTTTPGELAGILFINKHDDTEHVLYVEINITFLKLKELYKQYLLKEYKSKQQKDEIIKLLKLNILFECSGMQFIDNKSLSDCGIGSSELQFIFVSFTAKKDDDDKKIDNQQQIIMKKYRITPKEHKQIITVTKGFLEKCKSSAFVKCVKEIAPTFQAISKHQLEQTKAFHDIKAILKEQTSQNTKKARLYTDKILKKKPSGKLGSDVNTTLHIINNIFKSTGDECLFYDSRKGVKLKAGDSGCGIHEAFLKDKPFVLRLKNLKGLYGVSDDDLKDDKNKLIEMQSAININVEHPTLKYVTNKLSAALGVKPERIHINKVFSGSGCFQYTVQNLLFREKMQIIRNDASGRMGQQFTQFKDLKIHPLLFRPAFDVAMFDARGNKSFVSSNKTFQIGPANMKKTYQQPYGWTRYGLKVLGKYPDDKWLHPFNDPGNWWRAFHGTKNAGLYAPAGTNPNNAPVNQLAGNYNQFNVSRRGGGGRGVAYGDGVYCSPKPSHVDTRYAGSVQMTIRQNNVDQQKTFKFMLQVAVRPGVNTLTPESRTSDTVWAVISPQDIRAYGILIKEV